MIEIVTQLVSNRESLPMRVLIRVHRDYCVTLLLNNSTKNIIVCRQIYF
jgi:hypothetical protein